MKKITQSRRRRMDETLVKIYGLFDSGRSVEHIVVINPTYYLVHKNIHFGGQSMKFKRS